MMQKKETAKITKIDGKANTGLIALNQNINDGRRINNILIGNCELRELRTENCKLVEWQKLNNGECKLSSH